MVAMPASMNRSPFNDYSSTELISQKSRSLKYTCHTKKNFLSKIKVSRINASQEASGNARSQNEHHSKVTLFPREEYRGTSLQRNSPPPLGPP